MATAEDSSAFNGMFEPGQRVRNPARPDWGTGQVQSVVGARITANFDNAGKVLINVAVVSLELVD
jgi:hypothetical protein